MIQMIVRSINHDLKHLVEGTISRIMVGKQVKLLKIKKSFNQYSLDFLIF